ncbi:hypothetical protein RA280_16050 [Cupriavidus sp. CV2]|uniref:hypothetical protein n=1 Tax=Cupriavidus ulmosensis TaxID=3065913 RepID=UPI00296B25FA|nr:hypothetical protein [Cupriavidus sp. CV2]MDW3683236.1 hypothetical protein [Cupriavidus sp. CV2]
MDKLTIKLTFTEFDNPELIDHLTAIESARHRARALRRLAEIGLAAQRMGLRLPPSGLLEASAPSVRPTHAQATRATTTPKPEQVSIKRVTIRSAPLPAPLPVRTPEQTPASISEAVAVDHNGPSVSLPAGTEQADAEAGLPATALLDLNNAMNRFF